jgi:hypothetical protein
MADDIAEAQLRETEDKEAAMMKAVRPLHVPCFVTRRALADRRCRPTLYPRLSTWSGGWRCRAVLQMESERLGLNFIGRRQRM